MPAVISHLRALVDQAQRLLYRLNGDAAYQRYLAHWQAHHADNESQPLNRKAFFSAETQRKWNGIKRCC